MPGSDRQDWWVIFEWDDKGVCSPVLRSCRKLLTCCVCFTCSGCFSVFLEQVSLNCCMLWNESAGAGWSRSSAHPSLGRAVPVCSHPGKGRQVGRSVCCGYLLCCSFMRSWHKLGHKLGPASLTCGSALPASQCLHSPSDNKQQCPGTGAPGTTPVVSWELLWHQHYLVHGGDGIVGQGLPTVCSVVEGLDRL